ncbi:ATP-binding protein [Streptomyces sp. NEAU-Y11]|uniref:ATP-binding protein n=1 Tax=Streptomyces cucumeris TaxID=2962890 RepID=UPI0020C8651C|nr:ATP-binding protein [Streptomyces sp. NEAU-Y11]MCP9207796.1 ATP-binding protein [Streptomyces sp. NEAU-Y11]
MNNEKAPGLARRAVCNALSAWEYEGDVIETAALLTSELVTNAIRHAPASTCVIVRFAVLGGMFAIEVYDESPKTPARKTVGADSESGRGLALIEALTAESGGRCGTKPAGCGKWVFATLAVPRLPEHVIARELVGTRGVCLGSA